MRCYGLDQYGEDNTACWVKRIDKDQEYRGGHTDKYKEPTWNDKHTESSSWQ